MEDCHDCCPPKESLGAEFDRVQIDWFEFIIASSIHVQVKL
jgi:hypothetical protein